MMTKGTMLRIGLAFAIAATVAMVFSLPAWAGTQGRRAAPSGEGDQPAVRLPAATVTIAKKKHQWVITNIGDRFLVKHGTVITDAAGRQISLDKLKVPCTATIVFQEDRGVPKAHRIRITGIAANADDGYTADMPE